ncbi:MAG: DUF305 domain-containing protein [Pseudomonadota bacterium]|nr:DUF305 domain-containing protein [Pseudomonadota bacterium]
MHRTILIGAASALTLMAGACGTNEEAPQNEMAAANDMNRMMADPNNPFAQAEAQMHERMMAAAGADPSETWIRKMIEHHRGAVAMSDIVLAQNPTPQVRAEAEKTRTDQLREIGRLEAMLTGEEAAAPATAPPAAESRPATGERTAAKPAPRPAPKPAPEPAPDPHAGHDMNNMQ